MVEPLVSDDVVYNNECDGISFKTWYTSLSLWIHWTSLKVIDFHNYGFIFACENVRNGWFYVLLNLYTVRLHNIGTSCASYTYVYIIYVCIHVAKPAWFVQKFILLKRWYWYWTMFVTNYHIMVYIYISIKLMVDYSLWFLYSAIYRAYLLDRMVIKISPKALRSEHAHAQRISMYWKQLLIENITCLLSNCLLNKHFTIMCRLFQVN